MSNLELHQIDNFPQELLEISIEKLYTLFPGPTLLHLQGKRAEPVFVSVLLHGNEGTGLHVIQRLLKKYQHSVLPRSVSIFFGNTQAARYGKRVLGNQFDYNRVWPGSIVEPNVQETIVMQKIVNEMERRNVFASIDIHNNTVNPVAPIKRVSFGTGYIKKSILECFEENLEDFCILLPIIEKDDGTLSHLRLHNGTIWRWNRPLLGFNEKGQPHIRIEHRTIPAGPTFVDMIANAAFFYGLQHYWAQMLKNGHFLPEFTEIKSNFYTAARHSFDHSIIWFGKHIEPAELLHNILLPQAEKGLSMLNISLPDIKKYLSIIAARTDNQQTGASWQRKYVALHKCDMTELTRVYQHFQESSAPVHTWGY